ncbi:MAG: hypothetical protein COB84_08755 [Rhodobacteraceae bacterium]|nr:MAG: hypothetical protein COB84_08755 [Paracoccaceae bacterium]
MFKRRNPKTYWQAIVEFMYPKKGWRRGMDYIGHRVKRLPDTPHKIAIGIAAGAFVTFSPLFGLHVFLAWGLARLVRGNALAAVLGTFVGNPITFPFIATTSYQFGVKILGLREKRTAWTSVRDSFFDAFGTVWQNTKALFGATPSSWDGFVDFMQNVFLPYLVGGILPGLLTGAVLYFVTKPLIATYQKRRRAKVKERIARKRATQKPPED